MKLFVAFSALLAVASAGQYLYLTPDRYIPPSIQYHSQDGIGQYAYGYNDHLSSKQEIKSLDGITRGSYSYIDSNNVVQTVDYTAGAGGFQVAATNLPKSVEAPVVPVQDLPQQVADTPEVAAAKSAHLAAVEKARQGLGEESAPQQVQDTPEVAVAKAIHLAAIEEAKKQAPATPAPLVALLRPVEDTPEVYKAKAEHLVAVEQAKLRNSNQPIGNGISVVHRAPLIVPQIQLLSSNSLSLPPNGFSYSSSVVNAPISNFADDPYVKYQVQHFANQLALL